MKSRPMLIDGFLIWRSPAGVHVRGEHPKLRTMIEAAEKNITEPSAWDRFWDQHAKAYERHFAAAWLKYCGIF